MKNPTVSVMFAALLLVGALAVLPQATAQATETVITDDAGDVQVSPGTSQAPPDGSSPLVLAGADAATAPYDMAELKVFGETATTLFFSMSVQDFLRANTFVPTSLVYTICFDWSATGASYRFVFPFTFPTTPPAEASGYPLFQVEGSALERLPEGTPCSGVDQTIYSPRITGVQFNVDVNYAEKTVTWSIPRKYLGNLVEDGTPADAPPNEGDTLANIKGYSYGKQGPTFVYYDETPMADYTFISITGNDKLIVSVPDRVQGAFGVSSFSAPTYAVEKGSFQVVPVFIENHFDHEMSPNITVSIVNGDEVKWTIRTLAGITIGPKVGEVPGTETISLIVNADPSVQHKDKVTMLIRAMDPNMPNHLGAALVDVVAVQPLKEGEKTKLFFHGTGDACNQNERWVNTLDTDSIGVGTELAFTSCDPQGGGTSRAVTQGIVARTFEPDVPFGRNYILSTGTTAKAEIVLKSVVRVPVPSQPHDQAVPMIADVKVELLSGLNTIAEAMQKDVEIPGTNTKVQVDIPIQARILGGFGRAVPDDEGLRVRVTLETQSRVIEYCNQELCGFEGEQDIPSPTGKVYMSLTDSWVDIPVASSEKAGAIVNITASGALLTLRQSDPDAPDKYFVNPGKSRVFNITVRNEGVNKDTAVISATLNKAGWKAQIVPQTSYPLKVGQPRVFNVKVTAPEEAREGDTLRLTVIATSKVDPDASAQLPFDVEVTTQQQIDEDDVDKNLKADKKVKDSPAPAVVSLLAVLALVGAVLRRRR